MKITGIKKIAGQTKNLKGYYDSHYYQLNYNLKTGEAWTNEHCSYGCNSWTEYDDENIICCGNLRKPMTMTEIREQIETTVNHYFCFCDKMLAEVL